MDTAYIIGNGPSRNDVVLHELDGTSAVITNASIYSRFANGAGYILLNMYYMTT